MKDPHEFLYYFLVFKTVRKYANQTLNCYENKTVYDRIQFEKEKVTETLLVDTNSYIICLHVIASDIRFFLNRNHIQMESCVQTERESKHLPRTDCICV